MVFSSPTFVWLFLPLVIALYFGLPRGARNGVLLTASLVFYAWGEQGYLVVMLASIAGNFACGLRLGACASQVARRRWLIAAVTFDLGMLVAFKYAGWLGEQVASLLQLVSPGSAPRSTLSGAHLPIGISFFTFQALSYVVDVYRRRVPVQKSLVRFALYVASFPQLVAGPIVRYGDVAVELGERRETWERFALGARRFVLGLGKKVLVANVVARAVDDVFALAPGDLSAATAWLGIVLYALQIYFDFSGYSDMAIGLGHVFGFTFLENFAHPYASRSVTEFWRRWHISLSSWFRDYLYIPLGGSRGSPLATARNLVIVFFLCGLWHGASWSFVVWGLFHGAFLVTERVGLGRWLAARPRVLGHVYTWLVVLVGWVFFRAPDLTYALAYLGAMFSLGSGSISPERFVDGLVATAACAGVVGSFPWLSSLRERVGAGRFARACGDLGLAACAGACALVLSAGTYDPFIYFRF